MFNVISEDIAMLNVTYKSPVYLVGDFNSRTGLLSDYLEIEK